MAKPKRNNSLITGEKFETVYKSQCAVRYGDPKPPVPMGQGESAGNLSSKSRQPRTSLLAPQLLVSLSGNESLQRLVSLLRVPKHTYVDAIAILSAPAFAAALETAINRCVNNNDVGHLSLLLDRLADTNWYKPVLLWACTRCGIYFTIGKKIVRSGPISTSTAFRFFRSPTVEPRSVKLAQYITSANVGTLHAVLSDYGRDKPGARNREWWVRLKGSFGG